ncbi:hypothetical protein RJ639_024382 [Escallonia herrerae]|uniref:X8 domain-containing protein n=1 Tax=Escallonia herrerae TaxID=1293975 RepID=A0AA88V1G2_9ASTE|nr:hypothetical protein RJ639_024382 [Escallonia herrerae]
MAAGLVFLVLILSMAMHSSAVQWCVCKQGTGDAVLQKTVDYACGAGADCTLIHQNGACYNPNTLLAHCNYAVNSYFQRKAQASGSCDFAGSASVVTSDPSTAGCVYPSSTSAAGTTTTPITANGTSSTTTTNGGTPYVTTPSTGVVGGVGSGLGPSGPGINDESHAGVLLERHSIFPLLITLVLAGFVLIFG